MNTTANYTYDPDIGLPIDSLQGGITLVDDSVHVKVWKNSESGVVTVCIVPMNGAITKQEVLSIHNHAGGTYPGHYSHISPTAKPPQKYRNKKPVHSHDWKHPAVKDRSPSNWCGICKDWFVPDAFAKFCD